ncbi:MAG: LTA synthase family protein [Gammaproteobacteria bacterium]|nr:LTA synthase family protein [Gammaproteobacteria bacterium]
MFYSTLSVLFGYRYLVSVFIGYFVISGCFRFILATDHQALTGNTFLYGLRMDLIIISLFSFLSVILYSVNLHKANRIYLGLIFSVFIFLEMINLHFFAEFNLRLNYLLIDNLAYLGQILPSLFADYRFSLISTLILLPAVFYIVFRYSAVFFKQNTPLKQNLIALPFLLFILLLSSRGSLGQAAPSPSYYSWSSDNSINEISTNTVHSLLSSFIFHEEDNLYMYGQAPTLLKKRFGQTIQSSLKKKKRIVLTIMESFGHLFVGSLGGKKASPEFDRLTKKGLFFSNMYSSSNRTNRGIEAILSSIYPFVGRTYLKLPDAQGDFWTLASSLKQQGYRTVFLYGGDIKFDNMKSFLLSNGFDEIIDSSNIGLDTKEFSWGYADEDIYNKAIGLLQTSDQPIFLTILTLSNHKPFDFPENRISLFPDADKKSFENATRYADWALGKFSREIIEKDLFNDSLLVYVADHNADVKGSKIVPVERYRIPALFLGEDIGPREITGVTHQADIAPTLLAAAGINTTIPAQGFNMLQAEKSRALIIKQKSYAFVNDQGQVIFQPEHKPIGNQILTEEGLALIYNSYAAYKNHTHK